MKIEIFPDADAVAQKGAELIAAEARAAVKARGCFIFAVSGGHTPWQMLRALATKDVPWDDVNVVQVDERVAPAGDPDRNLTHLYESLLEHAPVRRDQIYAMPVEAPDLETAAERYAETLKKIAGSPPVPAPPRSSAPVRTCTSAALSPTWPACSSTAWPSPSLK